MRCQGLLKIFRGPICRAHRAVSFAIAQLSCCIFVIADITCQACAIRQRTVFLIDSSIIQTESAINCQLERPVPSVTLLPKGILETCCCLYSWSVNVPRSPERLVRKSTYLTSIGVLRFIHSWEAGVHVQRGNGVAECGEHFNLRTSLQQLLQQTVTLTAHPSGDWHLITGLDATANTSASRGEI